MNKILVIDDDTIVRTMLKRVLEKQGYQIEQAENGRLGLEMVETFKPNLILLDLRMPVMGGIEFLQQLHSDQEHPLSIIVLTGDGTEKDAEVCYQLGIHNFQRKPVEIVELKGLIKRNFDMLRQQAEVRELNDNLEQKVKERTLQLEKEVEEHKETADELKKLSRAVQQTSNMIMITDVKGNIEYVNPAFSRVTGYSMDELTGETPRILKSELQEQEAYSDLWKTIIQGHEWKGEMQNRKKNDEVYWISESITPLRDEHNEISHFVAVSEDITEKKNIEEALQIANEQLIDSYHDLDKLTQTFRLFVPAQLLQRIQSTGNEIKSGHSSEEKLTVLFSDIRGFTKISETLSAAQSFNLLSDYLNAMEPCITKYKGFIDKFIGDGIMALFDQQNSALNALQSAVQMQWELSALNQKREQEGQKALNIGIGINTGKVMVGALGTDRRLDSTVVGDHVNLTSRLEELTKKYKSKILISEYSVEEIQEHRFLMRKIDMVKVRGRSQPVTIYEVFECDQDYEKGKKKETADILVKGIDRFQEQKFSAARDYFQECINIFPQDIVAIEYVKRCDYYLNYPPSSVHWSPASLEHQNLNDHSIRRLTPRYSLQSDAVLLFNPENLRIHAKIKDLSLTGLRVNADHPFEKDCILEIEIEFSGTEMDELCEFQGKKLLGRVIWKEGSEQSTEQKSWDLGLELLVIPRDMIDQLRSILVKKEYLVLP